MARGASMGDPRRPKPEIFAQAAAEVFGTAVERVTAPGGSSRESVRIHMADRTVIATWRPNPVRRQNEATVLTRLSFARAPVPKLLGEHGEFLFQQDLGGRRLTTALATPGIAEDAAENAFRSILKLQRAAVRSDLVSDVPVLGAGDNWVDKMLAAPIRLARREGLPPPVIDPEALKPLVRTKGRIFVKWDARPGNACLDDDGAVHWFDWERCGRREGFEDFAWLMGDEFWTFGPRESLTILGRVFPKGIDEVNVIRIAAFTALHGAQRLALLRRHIRGHGEIPQDVARRYDKLGANRDQVERLAAHVTDWSVLVPGLDLAAMMAALPERLFSDPPRRASA